MHKKNILYLFIFFLTCITDDKKQVQDNLNPNLYIDCNYYWPAKQVHVCIKNMLKEECEYLFSYNSFIKEEECYCDVHKLSKREVETINYIQYDCKENYK